MIKINPKYARQLSLDEITAGCVQAMAVPIGCLRGKEARYASHRAVWYAVLHQMSGLKSHAVADYVGRHRSRFFSVINSMSQTESCKVQDIIQTLQAADFGG